jgi:hypothetical protein
LSFVAKAVLLHFPDASQTCGFKKPASCLTGLLAIKPTGFFEGFSKVPSREQALRLLKGIERRHSLLGFPSLVLGSHAFSSATASVQGDRQK